jgi:hypothetical protein
MILDASLGFDVQDVCKSFAHVETGHDVAALSAVRTCLDLSAALSPTRDTNLSEALLPLAALSCRLLRLWQFVQCVAI